METIREKLSYLNDLDVELELSIGYNKTLKIQGKLHLKEINGYSLTTYRVYEDGKVICDSIELRFPEDNVLSIVPIEDSSTIKKLLDNIRLGKVSVQWKEWSFSGGKTYGDYDLYNLIKDGKTYGSIEVNMDNGISIWLNGQTVCTDIKTASFCENVEALLAEGIIRDDMELVNKLGRDDEGNIKLPRDFSDITREGVLSGQY